MNIILPHVIPADTNDPYMAFYPFAVKRLEDLVVGEQYVSFHIKSLVSPRTITRYLNGQAYRIFAPGTLDTLVMEPGNSSYQFHSSLKEVKNHKMGPRLFFSYDDYYGSSGFATDYGVIPYRKGKEDEFWNRSNFLVSITDVKENKLSHLFTDEYANKTPHEGFAELINQEAKDGFSPEECYSSDMTTTPKIIPVKKDDPYMAFFPFAVRDIADLVIGEDYVKFHIQSYDPNGFVPFHFVDRPFPSSYVSLPGLREIDIADEEKILLHFTAESSYKYLTQSYASDCGVTPYNKGKSQEFWNKSNFLVSWSDIRANNLSHLLQDEEDLAKAWPSKGIV